jgi:predicted nucleic acid-binding Zn ribbon protein
MSFNSVDIALNSLIQCAEFAAVNQWAEVKLAWEKVVESTYQEHTRVLARRDSGNILYIATSSSSLAHYLSLQERSLLQKINQLLNKPIAKIRFSSSQWYSLENSQETSVNQASTPLENNLDHLCPTCQRKTPTEELLRWGQCRFCQIKNWSLDFSP